MKRSSSPASLEIPNNSNDTPLEFKEFRDRKDSGYSESFDKERERESKKTRS